jgi:hypothetical protein
MSATTNTAGTTSNANAVTQAPGNAESGYVAGVGNGGISTSTAGGNGLIVITYTLPACSTPTAGPSNLTFGTVTSTSISGSYSAASPAPTGGYLVVQSTSSTLSPNPVNGTAYSVSGSLGGGTVCAVNAPGTLSFTSNGTLTSGTIYYFYVIPFNYTAGTCSQAYGTSFILTGSKPTLGAVTNPGSPWTVPPFVYSVDALCWGGGGGGGGALDGYCTAGGGGGGGAFSKVTFAVTPGQTFTYSIGGGGGAGTNGGNGGAGGTTTATYTPTGAICSANGGPGGNGSGTSFGTTRPGVAGGTGGTGFLYSGGTGSGSANSSWESSGGGGGGAGNGGNGANGTVNTQTAAAGGIGGSPSYPGGTGGAGWGTGGSTNTNKTGNPGVAPGGAGGGGNTGSCAGNGTNYNGGAGAAGQVVFIFTVTPCTNPVVTNVSATAATICAGSAATVTVSSTSLASKTYTVTYTVSGANTVGTSTATMVFTAGSPGTGTFTTSALASAGASQVNITAIAELTCSSATSFNTGSFTVNAPPTAAAGTAVATCSNTGAINICAGASASNNASIAWSTSNGTGTFTSNTDISNCTYTPSAADISAGSRTLVLTSYGNAGCTTPATSSKTITITTLPVATFTYPATPYCSNASNPTPSLSGTAGTFSSTAGLNFVSAATGQVNVGTSTAGSYSVTNTIAAANGCSQVTASSPIVINTAPTVTPGSAAGDAVCQSASQSAITLVNASMGGSATSAIWSVTNIVPANGGVNGTFANNGGTTPASATYTPPNNYSGTITLTLTSNAPSGCTAATGTRTITVSGAVTPSVSAGITTGSNPTCSGSTVTFTATPVNGGGSPTYQWMKNGVNIGSATASTYTTPTLAVSSDIYSVSMSSNAACRTTTDVTSSGITLTVNAALSTPTISPSGTLATCAGSAATLTATCPGATSFTWSPATGLNTTSGATVIATGATNQTYTVTASAAGCANQTASKAVNSYPNEVLNAFTPTATFGSPVCAGVTTGSLAASATETITKLNQNFEAGTLADLASGTNWTTANTSGSGAAWTNRANNYVYNSETFSGCGGTKYLMSTSDGATSGTTTLTSPVFSTVGLTSITLTFKQYYNWYISGESANVEISTNNGSTWTSLASYTSDQGTAGAFTTPSFANLSAYAGFSQCFIRFRYVTTNDWYWCLDDIKITGAATLPTYSWTSTPAGYTSNTQNPTGVTAGTANTVYNVTATSSTGCTSSASTSSVTVTALPSAPTSVTPSGPTNVCTGSSLNLNATNSTGTIVWYTQQSPGGSSVGTSNSAANFAATPGGTTTYYAEALSGGCSSATRTATGVITPVALPTISTGQGSPSSCVVSVTGTPSAGATAYWQNTTSGGTSQSLGSPQNVSTNNTFYYRAYNATTGCWSSNGTVTVSSLSFPVAQTPTGLTYCTGGSGTTIGLANSETGVNYVLKNGSATQVGATVGGTTGSAISFTGTPHTTAGNTYSITATKTSSGCVVTNSSVTVSITPTPTDIVPTYPATVCSGSAGTVAIANSQNGYTYQLRNNSGNTVVSSGSGTGGTLNLSTGNLSAQTVFNVLVITNTTPPCSLQLSTIMTIGIIGVPAISADPQNYYVCNNGNASYSVTATGTSITYQWQYNQANGGWTNLTGSLGDAGYNTANLSLSSPTSITHFWTITPLRFRCVVSNSCGSVNSNQADLIRSTSTPTTYAIDGGPGALTPGCSATISSLSNSSDITGYNWTLSGTSWTLNSGQNTSAINLTAGTSNGTVTLSRSNACGTGNVMTRTIASFTASAGGNLTGCGNTVLTANGTPAFSTNTTLFSENFESATVAAIPTNGTANSGWKSTYLTTGTNKMYITNVSPISGTKMLAVGNATTAGTYDASSTAIVAYYGTPIDARFFSNLKLSFNYYCNGETGAFFSSLDYGAAVWSPDGVKWTEIGSDLVPEDVALHSVTNQTITNAGGQMFYIGFLWVNDGSGQYTPPLEVDDITITGTSVPTYSWSTSGGNIVSGGSTATPTVSTSGTYTVTVSANGCSSSNSMVATITPSTTAGTIAGSGSVCSGQVPPTGFTGAASTGGGGAGTYTYNWFSCTGAGCATPTAGNPTAPSGWTDRGTNATGFTEPSALTQTTTYVRRTTSGGCTVWSNIITETVNPLPAQPTLTVTPPSCASSNGAVQVNGTLTGLHFSSDGSTYTNTSGNFTVAAGAAYSITVKNDATGCISTAATGTMTAQPVTPGVPSLTVNPPSCASPNGTVQVNGTLTGLHFSSDGSTYTNTSGTFTVAGGAAYSITAKNDASNCISNPATGTMPSQPTVPAQPSLTVTPPACGSSNGSVQVNGTLTGLHFSSDGSTYTNTSGNFTIAAGAAYSITSKNDASGCISAAATGTMAATPVVPAQPGLTVNPPSCASANGSVQVNGTLTGLHFSSDGSTYTNTSGNFVIAGGAGYSITAKNDASGCISSAATGTMPNQPSIPGQPTLSVVPPSCALATGTVQVTSSLTNRHFSSDGSTYTNTNGTFTVAAGAAYSITAKDDVSGCISSAATGTMAGQPVTPSQPVLTITPPSCLSANGSVQVNGSLTGLHFSSDGSTYTNTSGNFTIAGGAGYSITSKDDASGCISTAATGTMPVQPAVPGQPTLSVTPPSCFSANGTVQVTSTLSGLHFSSNGSTYTNTSGTFTVAANAAYSITAKNDVSGCVSTAATGTMPAQPAIPAQPTLTVTPPNCFSANGSVQVNGTLTGLHFSSNGSTYTNTSGNFTVAAGAAYSITSKDDVSGCTSPAATGTMANQPAIPAQPTLTVTPPVCGSSNGTVQVNGTLTGLHFSSDGSTYTNTNGTFTIAAGAAYSITAKNDGSGCVSTAATGTMASTPTMPGQPSLTVTQPTCASANGSVQVNGTLTGLHFSSDGSTYTNTSGTFTVAANAPYSITSKNDASGCISTAATGTMGPQPSPPVAPTASVTVQPTCVTSTGTIVVSNPTGSGTYEYQLDGAGSWQSSTTFSGAAVTAGSHTITVRLTASPGCVSQASGTITVNSTPTPLTANPVSVCQGGSGSLTVNPASVCVDNFVIPSIPGPNTLYGGWLSSNSTANTPAGANNSTTCSFSGAARTYSVIQFEVSANGDYIFEMNDNTAYNGSGYIVTGNFTPGSCSAGTLVRADADGGTADEPKLGGAGGAGALTLTAGITYSLVSTTEGGSNVINNDYTWTVTPPAGENVLVNLPGTVEWYTVASGGSPIGSGTSFDPVGVDPTLSNTNTQGTWHYWAACSSSPSCRTAVDYVITSNVAIHTVTPGTSTCYNSAAPVSVGLNNSTNGLPYTLMKDGVTTGITVTGTGSALPVGNTSGPGTYTVNVTSGSCSVPMAGAVVIKPVPIANAGSDVTLPCGSNVTLAGSSNNTSIYTEGFVGATNAQLSTTANQGWKLKYFYGSEPANRTEWWIIANGSSPYSNMNNPVGCITNGSGLILMDHRIYQTVMPCDYAWDAGTTDELAYNLTPVDARLYTSVNLAFDYQVGGTFSGTNVYDYLQVMYSLDNGATWVAVSAGNNAGSYNLNRQLNGTTNAFFSGTHNSAASGTANVSMPSAVAGQKFLYGFRWVNDGAVSGAFVGGPMIDNIHFTGAPDYSWSPTVGVTNPNTATPTVTIAGTYTVTVTAGNGCSATDQAVVTSPSVPVASAVVDDCMYMNGANDIYYVMVTASGGTPGYTFTGNLATVGNDKAIYEIPAGGTATYTVTDASNCSALATLSAPVPVGHPTDIAFGTTYGTTTHIYPVFETKDCYDLGFDRWITYRDDNNDAMVSIKSGANNNLGKVTVTVYRDADEPSIPNSSLSGYNCVGTPMRAMERHFVVTTGNAPPQGGWSAGVGVRLYFTEQELNDLITETTGAANWDAYCSHNDDVNSINDLYVTKYTGANEDGNYNNNVPGGIYRLYGNNTTSALGNGPLTKSHNGFATTFNTANNHSYVELQVTEFSEFWLHGSSHIEALPVTMMYLEANAVNNAYIQLRWATALEINNKGFHVERSTDGQTWTEIGWVDGHNNTTTQTNYTFDDMNVTAGVVYYYRLKQEDHDGATEYTDIVSAKLNGETTFSIKDFVPNPTTDKTNLVITATKDQEITVTFYDVLGRKTMESAHQVMRGGNMITFELGSLSAGTYTAVVSSANEVYTKKVVLTR